MCMGGWGGGGEWWLHMWWCMVVHCERRYLGYKEQVGSGEVGDGAVVGVGVVVAHMPWW